MDIDLLKRANNGDSDAINQMLTQNKNLVISIARKYYLLGEDIDDLIQEGMIGLYRAIVSFDESKNNNFVSYACKIIERSIISAIRHSRTENNQVSTDCVLVDDNEKIVGETTPEDDFICAESEKELAQEIEKNLSSFEQEVVKYFLKGYTYKEIAKMFNKTDKSIDNALSRIKSKLKYLKERL